MLSGELAYKDYKSKQSLFALSVEGEWRAMIRAEINTNGGRHYFKERLAQTACLAGSQDRTALGECFVRKLTFEHPFFICLLMLFRS
jgi:hypothetical protein